MFEELFTFTGSIEINSMYENERKNASKVWSELLRVHNNATQIFEPLLQRRDVTTMRLFCKKNKIYIIKYSSTLMLNQQHISRKSSFL